MSDNKNINNQPAIYIISIIKGLFVTKNQKKFLRERVEIERKKRKENENLV